MEPGKFLKNTIFLWVFFIYKTAGQTVTILDSYTHEPLEYVNVFIDRVGKTTNKLGICSLDDFDDNDQISFNLIGYKNIILLKTNVPNQLYMENEIIPIDIVNVVGRGKRSKRKYKKLERDVKRTYPYAKIIADILPGYDIILDSLNYLSGFEYYMAKKKIFSSIEKKLISEYGFSVTKLTKNQGRILIKLIDRETQKTSYTIIRDFRSVIHAGFWQITAKIFGHNLKSNFDIKNKEDRMIEYIISRMSKLEISQLR